MLTGVILAGGKGLRFGGNKALVKINGRFLIQWIIDTYTEIFDEIIISTNTPSAYEFAGIKTVKDIIPHKGPLVGIYSSLEASLNETIFVSACDMPFINMPLIRYMLMKSKGYDVVVPYLGEGKLEPLHALYKKSCLPAMEKALNADQARVIGFYVDVKVYTMGIDEIIQHDPKLESFFNINTPEDLEKAREIFKLSRCTSPRGCQS